MAPGFLFVGNTSLFYSASSAFPEFQRAGSNSCWWGSRRDAETRKSTQGKTAVQSWGRSWLFLKGCNTQNSIWVSLWKQRHALHIGDANLSWPLDCWKATLSPHHQPIRRKSHTPTLCLEEPLPEPSGSTGFLSHLFFLLRRRQWQRTLVLLPGKSHGWRSLVGCSPWDR